MSETIYPRGRPLQPEVLFSLGGFLYGGKMKIKVCEELKNLIPPLQEEERNLLEELILRIIIGRRYNREKKQGKRTDLTSGQNGHKLPTSEKVDF